MIYANDNYTVVATDDPITLDGVEFPRSYALVNNDTGVVEFRTPCLPEVLRCAAHWDIAITNENHLWPYTRNEGSTESSPDVGDLLQ